MKCLIVKKQWLDLIFSGLKIWEMRATRTSVRGTIGLIEAGTGTVVGTAELVDCGSPLDEKQAAIYRAHHCVDDLELLKKWKYPWRLRAAKRFDEPVPYRHPPGAMIWVEVDDGIFSQKEMKKTEV